MNPDSIIPQSDDRLLSYFVKEALIGLISDDSPSPTGAKRGDLLPFIILGLILIVGTEPYKVLLRRNIGKMSLSLPRLMTAIFLYFIFAAVLIGLSNAEDKELAALSIPLLAGGIFYALFGLVALFSGIADYTKAKQKYYENPTDYITHLYRGDSIYFKGKDQKNVWLNTETKFCFILSLLFTVLPAFIHPGLMLVAAPLLMTSLSFWFNEWYQITNVWDVQTKKIQKEQVKSNQTDKGFEGDGFNRVN